jgi:hypothetical protein
VPTAKTVAPAGRAFVFQDEAASSAAGLDVEAGRCDTHCGLASASAPIGPSDARSSTWSPQMTPWELAGAAGGYGTGVRGGGEKERAAYRSCLAGGIARCDAGLARRTQS